MKRKTVPGGFTNIKLIPVSGERYMNRWYYNVRNRETNALIAFRIHAGMLDGADRQQAQMHIERMNKATLTLQRYELFEEEARTQTMFDIQPSIKC